MQYSYPNTTLKSYYCDTILTNNADFKIHIIWCKLLPTYMCIQSKHAAYSHLVSYSSQLSDRFWCRSKEEARDGWQIDGYVSLNGVGFRIFSPWLSLSVSLPSCVLYAFLSVSVFVYLLTVSLCCSNTIWKCCTAACCGPLSIMYYCSPVIGEK